MPKNKKKKDCKHNWQALPSLDAAAYRNQDLIGKHLIFCKKCLEKRAI